MRLDAAGDSRCQRLTKGAEDAFDCFPRTFPATLAGAGTGGKLSATVIRCPGCARLGRRVFRFPDAARDQEALPPVDGARVETIPYKPSALAGLASAPVEGRCCASPKEQVIAWELVALANN